MFDGVPQHPIIKPFAITHANTCKWVSKIQLTHVRKQKGLDCKHLRTQCKNEQAPLHDLHLDQAVMYQDPNDKRWYPANITRLYQEPRSYLITTKQGVQYRKAQAHLKPYHPQGENELLIQEKYKRTVPHVQNKPSATNLAQSRPKRDIKPPNKLDL